MSFQKDSNQKRRKKKKHENILNCVIVKVKVNVVVKILHIGPCTYQ